MSKNALKIVCSYCTGLGGVHANIKILDLSHNNITAISRMFFRPVEISLTHLYLSHNSIWNATKDVFGSFRHLQWLDVSNNGMVEMDFDMFRNTKKLQVSDTHLNITYNRTYLSQIGGVPYSVGNYLDKNY